MSEQGARQMKTEKAKTVTLHTGTYSAGTMRCVDVIPVLIDLCKHVNPTEYTAIRAEYADTIRAVRECGHDWNLPKRKGGEWHMELWERLNNAINQALPAFLYFGNTEGDGSDYGVWLCDLDPSAMYTLGEGDRAAAFAWLGVTEAEFLADPYAVEMPDSIEVERL